MSAQDDEATALREYGMRVAMVAAEAMRVRREGELINLDAIVASVEVPVRTVTGDELLRQALAMIELDGEAHDPSTDLFVLRHQIERFLVEQQPESAPTKPRWRLRTICCGREQPPPCYFPTWEEADAARQSYVAVGETDMVGHERVGIIEATEQPPESARELAEHGKGIALDAALRVLNRERAEHEKAIAAADAAGYLRGLEMAAQQAYDDGAGTRIRALIAAAQSKVHTP